MRCRREPCFAALLMVFSILNSRGGGEVTVTGQITLIHSTGRPTGQGEAGDNSNAAVWLIPLSGPASPLESATGKPAPAQRFRLVQRFKRFTPHLLVVPVGSVVEFPNLDPFFHNVFSLFEGKRFDLGLYEAGTTRTVNFNVPGFVTFSVTSTRE